MSEQTVAKVTCEAPGEEQPRVEVLSEALCTASELRQAVIAGAITSGIFCTIVGMGIGYLLAPRRGRD
ncbi:hypothetical protein [Nannocystis bainbridge]|uniref:Uncharacterized protein n=1 Tax=Nannocystis bainbridge TaxID=2995303 RepID=A0ABT5E5B0_9BACT|nr:hypothetical protein [Nannocystis bainbridge]MDC0720900.1 hypothetical protein [Nannocystis bainbridge]